MDASIPVKKMKAVVFHQYGPPNVLLLKELDRPVPKDNQILIKVHATTVTTGDCELRKFKIPVLFWLPMRIIMGIKKRKGVILGQEVAGEVVATGEKVSNFKVGDQVFGATLMGFGGCANYISLSASNPIALKPEKMSLAEAATIPTGGFNALHFLKKGEVKPGDKVLIIGAGGSIGTYAVQIAKVYGAEVTSIDHSSKLEMLRAIGSDYVIDYMQEDYTRNGVAYDVIIDIIGNRPYSQSLNSLKPHGRFVCGNPGLREMLSAPWVSRFGNKKVVVALADYKAAALSELISLIDSGQIRAIIDKTFPMEHLAEAHRYVESAQKKGHVVIDVR